MLAAFKKVGKLYSHIKLVGHVIQELSKALAQSKNKIDRKAY